MVTIAMNAVRNAEHGKSQSVEMCNRMEDICVSVRRGTKQVSSLDDGSREIATCHS